MKIIYFITSLLFISEVTIAQQITGEQLLEKAIAYHDPNNNWNTFKGTLNITMETPKGSPRVSKIDIDLANEFFKVVATRDTTQTMYSIHKEKCTTSITDSITKPQRRTPCETATLYKNYYTYLYGLPMKLKDPGTNIHETVERKNFKGKEYLVLKATYDEAVGSDVWFFYFDPTTYAMEIYQFFKGDPNGKGKDTGEYILLTEEAIINDIKFPATRAWYYNKDEKYLGTDILKVE